MQQRITKQGFIEKELDNMHVRGGLVHTDRIQKITITYLESTDKHQAKVCIKWGIGSESNNQFIENPSSLRFNHWNILRAFALNLFKAALYLGKKQGCINTQNKGKYFNDDYEKLKEIYKGIL